MTLHLHGIGHFHPENEITNAFLESLDIGTNEAWIMERVGIRSRRTVLSLDYIRQTKNEDPRAAREASSYDHAQLGARAARMAIERAGITPSDIGLVIAGGSAPDHTTPAEACTIAAALEIEKPAFDMNSACTSFFVPMHLLSMMDPARVPDFALIVTAETLTGVVDYRDRSTAVIWGDGAAAAVVSLRVPGRAQILGTTIESSPKGSEKVVIPRQSFFRQEGQAVQKFAVKAMTGMVRRFQQEQTVAGRSMHFVGHQANVRMLESVSNACGIATGRHHHNVVDYGNTAAAGAPSVISMRWSAFSSEDDVAVAGVGAGLTWSSFLLRF
jgi:3-oxoacyl-[acyl-carrier-protein] synthase-3